jgi:porphobilinogen deaminase
LAAVDDPSSRLRVSAERAVLVAVAATCSTPIGAHARVIDGRLELTCALSTDDRYERLTRHLDLTLDTPVVDGRVEVGDETLRRAVELGLATGRELLDRLGGGTHGVGHQGQLSVTQGG